VYGVASVFTLSLATVRKCSTSAAVAIIRIGEFMGYICLTVGMFLLFVPPEGLCLS
jgi:hypothetical protein